MNSTSLRLAALAIVAASVASCAPIGRTVSPKWNETRCFLDLPELCVKLTNVETEGNCNFDVVQRQGGADTVLSSHAMIQRRGRVSVSFRSANYQLEVLSTVERVFESDEATFVLHDAR